MATMQRAVHVARNLLPGVPNFLLGLVITALALCAAVNAQTVRVANYSHLPFDGWHRTTVDTKPAHAAGTLPDGTRYVLGRQLGLAVWAVDLHLTMTPGEERAVRLELATASPPPALPLPGDPIGHFGGWATFGGVPMSIIGLEADGAAWNVHLRSRVGRTFVCDVWLDWRPDEPWLAAGEILLTSSNPSVPDVIEAVPAGGLAFSFGDGMVFGNQPAVPGTSFADGQGRATPITVAWPRHAPSGERWLSTVPAAVNLTTCAVGIARLWPGGNPRLPPGLNTVAWTQQRWNEALSRMRSWVPGVMGANASSTDTGAQGDQVWVAGECMAGLGPEKVAYISALKMFARPAHHRRPDGSLLDPAVEHPGVQFWQARPHQQSTHDLLGKARGIDSVDTNGWWGPDREHWLYNTVAAAARLTGSRALQCEMSHQALLFLASEVLPGPGHGQWVTAGPDSPRAVGWACLLALHLWHDLEDRPLAARVRQRIIDRFQQVYLPAFGSAPGDVWDVRTNDPRLGTGSRWMPWQQSVGAYGLDRLGVAFGIPAARDLGLRAAKAVLRDAVYQTGGRWQCYSNVAIDGGVPEPWNGYWLFGMPMAVATVLAHEPQNEKARAVWAQMLVDAVQPGEVSWLPPETVLAPVQQTGATSVTQRGITWTFASARPVGQFCNGDWWVVGPVTVTGITPGLQTANGRTTGGSMLNPLPLASGRQGYDSHLFAPYLGDETGQPRWRPEMSLQVPATITTGSIVSTVPQFGPAGDQVSVLKTACVLTVLASAPPADAFRPAYAGTDKSIPAVLSDVDWSALQTLAPAPGMPDMAATLARFQGSVWLDHFPSWTSRYMHPVDGLPDYYRGFSTVIGNAALAVNCSGVPATVRQSLTVALCQMGIDNHRHMQLGARWGVNGHCNGRKFPILFAGRMLGDAEMLSAGVTYAPTMTRPGGPGVVPFSEDGQTFYVRETSPGVFNWGFGGYTEAHVGLPEWGNFHLTGSPTDYREWANGAGDYRRCCSANGWAGVTLAMRAMALRDAWNQPAYFDYMDRYMQTEGGPGTTEWTRAWEPWQARMWDMHRGGL
jgi:hypothetical protein